MSHWSHRLHRVPGSWQVVVMQQMRRDSQAHREWPDWGLTDPQSSTSPALSVSSCSSLVRASAPNPSFLSLPRPSEAFCCCFPPEALILICGSTDISGVANYRPYAPGAGVLERRTGVLPRPFLFWTCSLRAWLPTSPRASRRLLPFPGSVPFCS